MHSAECLCCKCIALARGGRPPTCTPCEAPLTEWASTSRRGQCGWLHGQPGSQLESKAGSRLLRPADQAQVSGRRFASTPLLVKRKCARSRVVRCGVRFMWAREPRLSADRNDPAVPPLPAPVCGRAPEPTRSAPPRASRGAASRGIRGRSARGGASARHRITSRIEPRMAGSLLLGVAWVVACAAAVALAWGVALPGYRWRWACRKKCMLLLCRGDPDSCDVRTGPSNHCSDSCSCKLRAAAISSLWRPLQLWD
eukprot:361263-Chlamydomonas_euryale.AAC.3